MNNWRKHGEDRGRRSRLDGFSSAIAFTGWIELAETQTPFRAPPIYEAMPTACAETRLLREGWRRAGTISVFECPRRE